MSPIIVGQDNSVPIELYLEDVGSGDPIVLLSGWPFDGGSWEPPLDAGHRTSEETVRALRDAAADASPWATWACSAGWLEDLSDDLAGFDVPTLIVHGTEDRISSLEGQARRLRATLPESRYVEITGGAHLVGVTHPDEVNRALLTFLDGPQPIDTAV
jgi:pimeloyl-ACP methyl ester carboxylesterase